MLTAKENYLFVYVVDRDFGFAPNPFHGCCTLATCKPGIRKSAQLEDWVMGVGGTKLKATGRCIYFMKITETISLENYWRDSRFESKKPLRNGSSVMMVGDNIYHRNNTTREWIQEDSHHSSADGSTNMKNLVTDTRSDRVLISSHFYYFGSSAPRVNLEVISYRNGRHYRKLPINEVVADFIQKMETKYFNDRNLIIGDPFDFAHAAKRVDQATGKLS